MNPENFAEWMRYQGCRVLRTKTSFWVEQGPRVYQAFPYHWVIHPTENELRSFLKDQHAIGLRYSTSMEQNEGAYSYHVVLEKQEYKLAGLQKKSRHDVEKGLSAYRFEPVSFNRMADGGWELRADTLIRQARTRAESKDWWRKMCEGAGGLEGFEAWGAFSDGGQLAASLIAFTCDDCVSILYHQSRTEYLSNGVNNALAYTFTQKSLQAGKWLFYGLHSLDAPASVDAFKFRMGYSAKPVRQRVTLHPGIAPLFNPLSHLFLRAARRLIPSNGILAKAEGLTRFHLQGKLPLEKQPAPPCINMTNSKD
jgi:hypothetical protein